jgi:hypothetical protein
MSSAIKAFLIFCGLISATAADAAFGFKLDGTLDKTAISKAYFEGDFHRILPPLEAWRTSRATKSREDSIFVYKYLSVIYAAEPATQKKAESYMVQLLKLMPTIELVDMYISDNIEAIFKDVQGKFLSQQKYVREHDELGNPIVDSSTAPKHSPPVVTIQREPSHAWVWWTLGGLGAAATATTIYFVANDDKPTTKSTDIKP